MKFIWNFIFFGFLIFLISKFLPDAFNTLVSWVNVAYDWIAQWVLWGWQHLNLSNVKPPEDLPKS